MEGVYESTVVIWIIFMCWFTYRCYMDGYTTKRKNSDDYIEINRKQCEKNIAQVKVQDKYDNDWGYIR